MMFKQLDLIIDKIGRGRVHVASYIGLLFLVISAFQNCAPPGSTSLSSNIHYTSPFDEIGRILIDQNTFEKLPSDDEVKYHGESSELDEYLNLIVLVDNQCAYNNCFESNNDSLTCELFDENFNEKLIDSLQFYPMKFSRNSNSLELDSYLNKYPTDIECIKGVTNERLYQSNNDPLYMSHQKAYTDEIGYESIKSTYKSQDYEKVRVAVIDTGVGTGEDLTNIIDDGRIDARSTTSINSNKAYCDSYPYSHESPSHYHGSFVAGIISAQGNNALGMRGLAPNAEIVSFAVGNCLGQMTNYEIANAIFEAVNSYDSEVINMSLGGKMPEDFGIMQAIVTSQNQGVFIVVAAGNDKLDLSEQINSNYYPAAYSKQYTGVVSVASVDTNGNLSTFSNYGDNVVTLAAPGENILSTLGNSQIVPGSASSVPGDYATSDGTSFAAPIVTSAVALALGRLKKLKVVADLSYLKDMLIYNASTSNDSLNGLITNGSIINFDSLYNFLKEIEESGEDDLRRMVEIDSFVDYSDEDNPFIEITFSWDINSFQPGARIGVFDLTPGCKFQAVCRMGDYVIPENTNQMTIRLERNTLAPMMAGNTDPTYPLPFAIAIYYPVPKINNGELVGYDKTYGTQDRLDLDLRSFDFSGQVTDPRLLGNVTNIRKDMQNLYIKGWSCFEGDNDTVTVGIVDMNGIPLSAKGGYLYSYMTPHSGVLDNSTYIGGRSTKELEFTIDPIDNRPNVAFDVSALYVNYGIDEFLDTYESGMEGNPLTIKPCKALTASNAFEFILPLKNIAGLSGERFKIIASHNGTQRTLETVKGAQTFLIPEIAGTNNEISKFKINRDLANYSIETEVCVESPAQIEVEVGYGHHDFRIALIGKDEYVQPGKHSGGFFFSPNRDVLDLETGERLVHFIDFNKYHRNPNDYEELVISESEWPEYFNEETIAGIKDSKYGSSIPNLVILGQFSPNANFSSYVATLDLQRIGTGEPTTYIVEPTVRVRDKGEKIENRIEFNKNISERGFFPIPLGRIGENWDWYDVGLFFSIELVGYKLDQDSRIGKQISDTYGVSTLLREAKKFETPHPVSLTIIDNNHMQFKGDCSEGRFRHEMNYTITQISNYMSEVNREIKGFFPSNDLPDPTGADAIDTTPEVMSRMPLTFRFFQDGRLILHIVTDHTDNYDVVEYGFNDWSEDELE